MNVKNNGFEFLKQLGGQSEGVSMDALSLRGFIISFSQDTGHGVVRCVDGNLYDFFLDALRGGMIPAEGRFVIFSLKSNVLLIEAIALDPDRLDQLVVVRSGVAAVKCPHCEDYVVPRASLMADRPGKRVCPRCCADFASGRIEPVRYDRLESAVFGVSIMLSMGYSLWAGYMLASLL